MFNLTKQERAVLIALGFVLLFGSLFHFVFKDHSIREVFEIVDGEKIYPKVNVNKAKFEDLLRLPGIGPALAKSIITYREQKGPFIALEDVRLVEGINTRNYSKLVKFLKIEKRGR